MRTVLVTRRTAANGLKLLEAETDVRVHFNPTAEELAAMLPGVHVVIAGVVPMYDAALLDGAPDLLAVVRHGVGLDNVDLAAATERGICVMYTPQAMIVAVAEHAVGLMLAAAKSFNRCKETLLEGAFHRRDQLGAVDLHGKTLGIVGCGRIGSRVSKICALGLGMKVITYDPYISAEQAAAAEAELRPTLEEVLATSDVVSLHCPLTAETWHMIGQAQLALMKPTAYLINTARGPVVDEQALLAALCAGRLAGAGLDVFEEEPPATDNPLLSMPNVVATPHAAGSSKECLERVSLTMAQEILALLHGEKPQCLANPEVWERHRPLS